MNTQTFKPLSTEATHLADQVADNAGQAIRSTQGVANAAFDKLSEKVESVRDRAVPVLDRLAGQAEVAARRSADAVRETSAQLRERATRVSDSTVGYIKDEPVKAMLIAAATGAVLMALMRMLSRSRSAA
jgi:ElaB/YqjD/DUF883 family membrane-anchored ribosome-binding protein